ncbi:hypothetical protein [Candidatus Uabimicrobium sp. HlEnr_7]|uniref:hypothetical protein n=1 Tax=Candidatus Uabimicrobium helgolandensis TaxID=3095367 RepID=UPI003555CFBE
MQFNFEAKVEKINSGISKNFLGIEYQESPFTNLVDYSNVRAKLLMLLEVDNSFADGFVTLGDELYSSGCYYPSLWCYMRARALEHPRPDIVELKIDYVYDGLKRYANNRFLCYIEDKDVVLGAITQELEKSQSWLPAFYKMEADLLQKHEEVDMAMTYSEMTNREIYRHDPKNHGVKKILVPYQYLFFLLFIILAIIYVKKSKSLIEFSKTIEQEEEFDEHGNRVYKSFKLYWR